jgi:hypothetical protein
VWCPECAEVWRAVYIMTNTVLSAPSILSSRVLTASEWIRAAYRARMLSKKSWRISLQIYGYLWKTSTEDILEEGQTLRIDNTNPTRTTASVNSSTVGRATTELTIDIAVCSCSPSNRGTIFDAMLMNAVIPTAPTIPATNIPRMAPALTTLIHPHGAGKADIRARGASRREGTG